MAGRRSRFVYKIYFFVFQRFFHVKIADKAGTGAESRSDDELATVGDSFKRRINRLGGFKMVKKNMTY